MKTRIALGTLVLMTLAACDNDADGSGGSGGTGESTAAKVQQPFVSGSRLKVRKIVGVDGAEQQLGFRDTELGLDCTFGKAEDGSTRCLPPSVPASGNLWADAACSRPIVTANCGKPAFISVASSDQCISNAAIWGDVTDYVGPSFTGNAVGGCLPSNAITTPGFYAGGSKMMLSAFAEGKEETE